MRTRSFTLDREPRRSWRVRAAVAGAVSLSALTLWAIGCGDSGHAEDRADASAGTSAPLPAGAAAPVERVPAAPVVSGPVSFTDARAAYRDERYDEAVTLFTIYTQQHPEDAAGQYLLGLSQWKAGHHALAIPPLEEAIALDSTRVHALYNLTRVLLESGKPTDALPRIERAVALDSTAGEGWRLLARTRAAMGQFPDAIDGYTQAIRLDSTDVWSMNNLALIYLEQGRFADALPALAKAVALRPGSAQLQNDLGMVLERSGYTTAAAEAYRAAVTADSSYGRAVTNLARVDGKPDVDGLAPLDLQALADGFLGTIR